MEFRRFESRYPSRSLHGQIVHSIGRQIVMGELRPGEPIPAQPDLPASRTAVREAIRVLVAKGLVEARPRTGTRVRAREAWNMLDPDVLAWSQDDTSAKALLHAITEVRRVIEPAAAELAARRATPAHLAAIERAFRDMAAAMPANVDGDVPAFVEADTRFHGAIFHATGNLILEQMSGIIYSALRFSFEATSRIPGSAHDSLPLHRAVADAIRARKPRRAAVAMRTLVTRIARQIEAMPEHITATMSKARASRRIRRTRRQ